MPAASYRELITIQKPKASPTLDENGHWDPSNSANWETHGTSVWANIAARGTREFHFAGLTNSEADFLIKLRYQTNTANVLSSYRIQRANGTFIALTGPAYDPENRRREIFLQGKQ